MPLGRTRQLSISPGMSPDMLRLIGEQRQINKEFDRRKPVTAPSVFDNDAQRPPARDNGGRIIFVKQADGSFRGQYSDGSDWQTLLATAVSFATPTITFGTTYAAGSATTTIRSDARLKFPTALMSSANSSTATLTDDATDQTLTFSLGQLNIVTANNELKLPYFTGGGGSEPTNESAIFFDASALVVGNTIRYGTQGVIRWNDASTYSGVAATGALFKIQHATGPTFTNVTDRVVDAQFISFTPAGTNSWNARILYDGSISVPLGAGNTVTDVGGYRLSGWPVVGTAGTYTNAYDAKWRLPTVGSTIRRGLWIETVTSNVGTEAANVEGIYVEDIPRGTSRRAGVYLEGATTGTPTDVYAAYQGTAHVVGTNRYGFRATGATTGTPTLCVGFYADAHSVGTTQWAFYAAGDESYFSGTQMDDNIKHVVGTGRDAELYYDGTDFVADPDVVGSGSFDIRGPLKCDSITNDTGLAHGVYTPTRSAEANMDANVTPSEAQYFRVGNTVTVSGRFTANPTLTATATSFELTLPVASNIGAVEDLAGVAFCGSIASQGAEVIGVVANDTAKVQWISTDVTEQTWSYVFVYQVI